MSNHRHLLAAASVSLAVFAVLPAAAQTPPSRPSDTAAGSTGATGAGDRTGSITSVGQTKPPGEAGTGITPELEKKDRELAKRLEGGICTGCD